MWKIVNLVLSYFDLQSGHRGKATGYAKSHHLTVMPQYFALVLGVVAQPFLTAYQTSGEWGVTFEPVISRIIFAILVGLIVFPSVYRSAFDESQPKFVQFCSIFALGIGWTALFASAVKATT